MRRVLAGNVDDVRRRLNTILERLDYDFIDEGDFEIQAKRNSRGWAGAYASANVLDYPRTLVIKFKPLSENLTRASFAYTVKHPSLNRGEKEVLTREAETIAVLATIRVTDKICAVCGTESTDDSRFCRKCGAPMTSDETALEILRMTAEIRSGHTSVAVGTVIGVVTALVNLAALLVLINAGLAVKSVFILLIAGIVLSLLTVLSIGFGWNRLNKALKTGNKEERKFISERNVQVISSGNTNALPPPPAFSVIEDTTELLNPNEKTPAFVDRKTEDEN